MVGRRGVTLIEIAIAVAAIAIIYSLGVRFIGPKLSGRKAHIMSDNTQDRATEILRHALACTCKPEPKPIHDIRLHEIGCPAPFIESAARALHVYGDERYLEGVKHGIWKYAWWKGGVQYVGSCGTTYKDAIRALTSRK